MDKFQKEPLFVEERKNKILELLKENSKLLVPDLCEYFKVSPATIRNDLRDLENAGLLKRTHGGAISTSKASFELDSYQKKVKNLAEKKAIAKAAAQLVEDGDTIAVDTGTTTLEFARLLTNKKGITVVLNDLAIAIYLEEHSEANIILIGGAIRRNFHCTVGPIAVRALSGLSVDKAFMATNGITINKGLTTPDINQAEVKRAMIDMASEIIVLCDSSKIGNNGFAQVLPISGVHRLITDAAIDERELKDFESLGITVDVVKA
jgi:DeoR family fructose operon transcriptional repressor